MTINNKSERNYRGKCLGWPVTSYGADYRKFSFHLSTALYLNPLVSAIIPQMISINASVCP